MDRFGTVSTEPERLTMCWPGSFCSVLSPVSQCSCTVASRDATRPKRENAPAFVLTFTASLEPQAGPAQAGPPPEVSALHLPARGRGCRRAAPSSGPPCGEGLLDRPLGSGPSRRACPGPGRIPRQPARRPAAAGLRAAGRPTVQSRAAGPRDSREGVEPWPAPALLGGLAGPRGGAGPGTATGRFPPAGPDRIAARFLTVPPPRPPPAAGPASPAGSAAG
jgi:hypothetical protein